MDWQRDVSNNAAGSAESGSPLYDGQHFGSLLQHPGVSGYPAQWQAAQMQAWMQTQQRAAGVWPGAEHLPFRQLFSDQQQEQQQQQQSTAGYRAERSAWTEAAHDVKTIENVLNNATAVDNSEAGHNHDDDEKIVERNQSEVDQSPGVNMVTDELKDKQQFSEDVPNNSEEADKSEVEENEKIQENKAVFEEMQSEDSPEEPRDLSIDREGTDKETKTHKKEESYDIIKNMTERYGDRGTEGEFQTRRCHLEDVLSKMNKTEEESKRPTDDRSDIIEDKTYEFEDDPVEEEEKKPIKLTIARGEIVKNTVNEEMRSKDEDTESSPKNCCVETECFLKLKQELDSSTELRSSVCQIVGEDVLQIFDEAVKDAENSSEKNVQNKNVVFLYLAVRNAANPKLKELKISSLEPISNLALSVPLLLGLVKFLNSDASIREQVENKVDRKNLELLEQNASTAGKLGQEFFDEDDSVPMLIEVYHSVRNEILREFYSKLTNLYSKTEHILNRIEATEDSVYNDSILKMKTLVAASWNEQVLEAENMKFNFEFLAHVYSFWKKVIAKRNKPEKKQKKPIKLKPLPPMKASDTYDIFGRPKRSSRRRNEMVTYDEDIMQDCNIKTEESNTFPS